MRNQRKLFSIYFLFVLELTSKVVWIVWYNFRYYHEIKFIKYIKKREELFTILNIENGRRYIDKCYQTKNKLDNLIRKKDESLIDYLYIKTIKLNWLFQRKPTKLKCKCKTIIDSNHVVNWCQKQKAGESYLMRKQRIK